MTGFEWTVVVLLVLILLKPGSRKDSTDTNRQRELMRSIAAIEDHLRLIRYDLENIQSAVNQIESCATAADLRALPEEPDFPPNPFEKR